MSISSMEICLNKRRVGWHAALLYHFMKIVLHT